MKFGRVFLQFGVTISLNAPNICTQKQRICAGPGHQASSYSAGHQCKFDFCSLTPLPGTSRDVRFGTRSSGPQRIPTDLVNPTKTRKSYTKNIKINIIVNKSTYWSGNSNLTHFERETVFGLHLKNPNFIANLPIQGCKICKFPSFSLFHSEFHGFGKL